MPAAPFVLPFVIGADYFIEMNGSDLLADYRNTGSEGAFSELVRRYTNLVYSIAKRRLSNGPLAEEVTQTVFTRLAKATPKAKGDAELVAWLHRTTVHVAIDVWRSETRRRTREQDAAAMEPACAEDDRFWEEIAPNLDEALDQLNDSDRQAVLLRYFDRKPMRDIGRVLGVSEDAAKMRLSRAIDRLRTQLKLRGVTCAAGALTAFMAERSVEAAPSQLVAALGSAQFTVRAASGLGVFALLLSVLPKAKLGAGLVLLAAVGMGVIGVLRSMHSGSTSNPARIAAVETQGVDNSSPSSRQRMGRNAGITGEASQTPLSAELEDLKRELRALLQKPPAGRGYPPPELTRLLAKFGDQLPEAAPILLEALNVQDYETRLWALSGMTHTLNVLQRQVDLEDRAGQVFALARPALSRILASRDEPSMLRVMVMHSYLPGIIYSNGALMNPPASLSVERAEDLLTAFRARDKLAGGIRYLIVNTLAEHFGQLPEDAARFMPALQSLLGDSDPHERLLAAYALASWPGEKPTALKDVLLAEVKGRATDHSHIAVQGLAKLGAQATDCVPDLLDYAEATKDWAEGYAESALKAACILQPDLRAQYPAIDAKMKQEEDALRRRAEPNKIYGPLEIANTLGDPERGQALNASFIASIKNSTEPEKSRESLVSLLEQALAQAPESQRAAVRAAIEAVRQIDTSIKAEETGPAPVSITSLVLEARLLLQDGNNPNENRLERALDEFHLRYIKNVTDAKVTTERWRALAGAIRDIDPEFHSAWRKQVLQHYPWLDRVLPLEKE